MSLPIVNAPKYSMTIPSSGEEVTYRPYLVKEEKVLMIAMESQDQNQVMRALTDTIESCTFGKVRAANLATFDLEYVFLQLRGKSVGETAKLKFKCSECDEYSEVAVDLNTIEAPKVEKAPLIRLMDNLSIQMKYPSVDAALSVIREDDASAVDQLFDTVLSTIDTIFYNDDVLEAKDYTHDELMAFIESLNADQFKALTGFVQEMPQAKTNVEWDCEGCGHHNERELKGLNNFF